MVKGRQTVRLPQRRKAEDATKADVEPSTQEADEPLSTANILKVARQVLPLLALAAFVSPVSQAILAPVYGSIPSSINHVEAVTATVLLGFIGRHLWAGWIGDINIQPYLALWALWTPAIEAYLFKYSGSWGPVLGPMITGFVSCHLFTLPSAYAAAQALESLGFHEQLGSIAGIALPAVVLDLAYFRPLEYAFSHLLSGLSTWSTFITPPKLQYLVACLYALVSTSKPYWLASLGIPALLHGLLANPHLDLSFRNTDVLNRDLGARNWTVLDRQWSNTGYISVIQGSVEEYRALRCDHSLLGGEWLLTDEKRKKEGWQVPESIYAIFHILEAVRLMEVSPAIRDRDAHALVVGLGIGTAPKAIMAHGIDTTIVELDPVVHEYATKYFGLPKQHKAVLQDAVTWVSGEAAGNTTKYEYIIHDVFTGGAEPLPLFTDSFLGGLRSLLKPNGVIAINYAGDLRLEVTTRILNTIYQTFDGQCKIFGDAPTKSGGAENEEFLNMAVFCRNSLGSIAFRKPTRADWLGSRSREQYLLPREDFEIPFPSIKEGSERQILKKGEEGAWRKEQEVSAIRHWRIMRRVIPDIVWELW
ncbi:hypothetical protein LTR10_002404 [Elasticomyces elasticus]|nr:hypothetical protein LTR10_002404 [Elasticomyces elasticus]KAK4973528.1 hypothetical protein LTR42_005517 [Elasticomyces elasticus]